MSTIKERFTQFHQINPHIYDELVKMCINYRAKGNKGKIGIKMLFEVMRWNKHLSVQEGDGNFKLNNDFTSHYARKIMLEHPEFGVIFKVRTIRTN